MDDLCAEEFPRKATAFGTGIHCAFLFFFISRGMNRTAMEREHEMGWDGHVVRLPPALRWYTVMHIRGEEQGGEKEGGGRGGGGEGRRGQRGGMGGL